MHLGKTAIGSLEQADTVTLFAKEKGKKKAWKQRPVIQPKGNGINAWVGSAESPGEFLQDMPMKFCNTALCRRLLAA
jgi:hypothetical protein